MSSLKRLLLLSVFLPFLACFTNFAVSQEAIDPELAEKLEKVGRVIKTVQPMLQGQSAPVYVEGKDYERLEQPVPVRDPAKIEVVELFWYGCGHCFDFESLISAWKPTLAADVDFWQSPAMWSQDMRVHARAFYTAEALGALEKMNGVIFNAMNVERKPLRNQAEIEALFASQGIKAEDFAKAYNSFSVASKVKQADARARSYKISGTPEVIVDGKYRVSAKLAGSQPDMIRVINFLIEQERRARTKP